MTERLAEVRGRLNGMNQLDAVMNAMAGIAAARAQQARGQIAAVDTYATNIAAAMGQIVSQMPRNGPPPASRPANHSALVLFGAEQGFVGAFSERVLDAIGPEISGFDIFLIGSRCQALAGERGIATTWTSAMPSHSAGLPKLADRIANAIFSRIQTGEIDGLDVVFSRWRAGRVSVERRHLFPVDLSAIPASSGSQPPLMNLPAATLLTRLGADYVHALICNAALHAFAAENEARMVAMAAARNQIERELSSLLATERQVRQEAITAEIIELATGELASQRDRRSRETRRARPAGNS